MNSESTPQDAPENEVWKTITYIDKAISITKGRVQDETLLKEVVDIFDVIKIICKMHFNKATQLQLLAGELLMGVCNPDLLKREIDYTRKQLSEFIVRN